mgnify:CR=1 FL=1
MVSLILVIGIQTSHFVITCESDSMRLIERGNFWGYETILQKMATGKWRDYHVCYEAQDVPREFTEDRIFARDGITICFLAGAAERFSQIILPPARGSIAKDQFLQGIPYIGAKDVFEYDGYYWSTFFVPNEGLQEIHKSGTYLYRIGNNSFTIGKIETYGSSEVILVDTGNNGLDFGGNREWDPVWTGENWVLN